MTTLEKSFEIYIHKTVLIEPSKIDFSKMTRMLPLSYYYHNHLTRYSNNKEIENARLTGEEYIPISNILQKYDEQCKLYIIDRMEKQDTTIIKTFIVTIERILQLDNINYKNNYNKTYEILYHKLDKVLELLEEYTFYI